MTWPATDTRLPEARYAANISLLFSEVPLLERPAIAAAAGFTRVELWWPFAGPTASEPEIEALVRALDAADVQLTGLNFWAGDMPAGDRGMACRPDARADLAANIAQVAQIARRTGCRHFNLLYGQLSDLWTPDEQRACAIANVRLAAGAVAPFGGTVLLEPLARGLNGSYPLETASDVADLLDEVSDLPNVRLLFDTFHLGHNGVDLPDAAREFGVLVGHVQFADDPGRGEPGTGVLPIAETLGVLLDGGYDGVVAAEYKPTHATDETLGWLPSSPAVPPLSTLSPHSTNSTNSTNSTRQEN